MTFRFLISSLLLLVLAGSALSGQVISQQNLKDHVAYLASDKMKGRGAGTKEAHKAAKYLARQFKSYGLNPAGNNGYFHEFTFVKPGSSALAKALTGRNVVARLDNGAENTIVIGAHFDHLGMGYDHNSLDPNPEGKIHNGADDNASGTAGVLELARYLSNNGITEKHNFLFVCFTAEELGLLGSKRLLEELPIDLSRISYMMNFDMIGRLDTDNKLVVGGVGTAPDFVPLIQKTTTDLSIKMDSAGMGPSDHAAFYQKDIPVLFFFTGQHADYHKPTDDVEKVNFAGSAKILEFALSLIQALDDKPKQVFQKTKTPDASRPRYKVTLGIMPDYTYDGIGLHIDGVTDDRPAHKAGILAGDVIVLMGNLEIKDIQDYVRALSMYEKGDTIKVKAIRAGQVKEFEVTF